MNYKIELKEQDQILLKKAGIIVEDRNYYPEEIRRNISEIINYIMSKSSKNGDINKARMEYIPIIDDLKRNIE